MSRPRYGRRCVLLWSVAVLLGLYMSDATKAQTQPATTWFKYKAHIAEGWEIAVDKGDPALVSIRPKVAQTGPAKKILVLYPRASSAYDIAISKVLDVFDAKEINAHFTVFNFELKDERGKEAIRLAADKKFDLILSMGSESTAWLYTHYRGGSIPVVSICSKDPVQLGQMSDYQHGSGNNFAFTSLNMPIQVQMSYILELKPDLKNLGILVDSKNVSAVQTQAEPIAAYAREKGINVVMGSVQNPKNAREELAHIVADAVATMRRSDPDLANSAFLITGSTSVFNEIRTINEKADRVPVLSMIPEIVTAGEDTAVVAMGISFATNAHLAAVYAADILNGRAKVGELKVGIVSPPDIAVSFLKVREIGLRIPFGFFETATFIYDYDGQPVRVSKSK